LYAYCVGLEEYLLIINASRIDADVKWLQQRLQTFPEKARVHIKDLSDSWGAVAVQGPATASFIDQLLESAVGSPSSLIKNAIGTFRFAGASIWISRTGYTGEDGFEIV